VTMKLTVTGDAGTRDIETEPTHTLDDLAMRLFGLFRLSNTDYRYDFGGAVYSLGGERDTGLSQCDLFLYTEGPVAFHSREVTLTIRHIHLSDTIYDYLDFENPHHCPAFGETIDIDTCYTSMMSLNGFIKEEACEELGKIGDMELARARCGRCLYTNCDGIHHEQTRKNIPLTSIRPSRKAYRVHLAEASPEKAEQVRKRFLERISESDDTGE